MLSVKNEEKKASLKWLRHAAVIFFIFIFLSTATYLGFDFFYKDKIFPNLSVAGLNLGGLTSEEAKAELNSATNTLNENGVNFQYRDKNAVITPVVSSFEGDIAFPVITFHINETIDRVMAVGRSGNLIKKAFSRLNSFFYKRNFNIAFSLKKEQIIKILEENYEISEGQAANAMLTSTTTWDNSRQKKIIFNIIPEKIGFTFEYEKAVEELRDNLSRLNSSPIEIKTKDDQPSIVAKDAIGIENKAEEIIKRAPLSLADGEDRWLIEAEELASWLGLEKGVNGLIVIGLNEKNVEKFLKENVAPKIEREPIDAKFEIKEGRVVEFQTSENGLKISPVKTMSMIRTNFLVGTSTEIAIISDTIESKIKTESVNDLGIKEIIGTGHSNFSGSPNNRIHNIKNGAGSISGVLIAPDEEFSLIGALGKIDADTGYLTELVIKGNRTIPEYGGGLCQIGTTIFRTALKSGLPITARRNHSYRVSYYEPAGTDATIYDPWPDLKFKNDTGNYILIQHHIDGNDLYFDFWGTKDGRITEIADPTIYNIISPGPTKMVETTDLAPGEKKCTESAHAGADAYFNYKVTYPSGEIMEEKFSSHYVPWQAVCLVGVEEKVIEKTSSSTEENIIE